MIVMLDMQKVAILRSHPMTEITQFVAFLNLSHGLLDSLVLYSQSTSQAG
jgi:hypothetical protein